MGTSAAYSSKWTLLLICGLLLIPAAPASGQTPLKIGATLSLTGEFSGPSKMMEKAYRLWEKEINQAGGLLGRRVELIIRDDRSDPGTAGREYEKMLADEGVELVLSPYSTPITLAAARVTESHHMPMIAAGASGELLWEQGFSYLFGMYAMAGRYFIGYLDLLAREGEASIIILHEENAFNIDAAEGAAAWAHKMGVQIIDVLTIEDTVPSLTRAFSAVKKADPGGLIVCSYPSAGYALLDLFSTRGWQPQSIAMTIIPTHPDFPAQAGPIAEGIFGPSKWEPFERIPFPGTVEFIRDFTKFAGIEPSYHAGSAYGACQILTRAIEKIGMIDTERIRNYIATLDTVTVIGRFKSDPAGRQVGHNPILVQWQDGRKEIVYPRSMHTAEPRF